MRKYGWRKRVLIMQTIGTRFIDNDDNEDSLLALFVHHMWIKLKKKKNNVESATHGNSKVQEKAVFV